MIISEFFTLAMRVIYRKIFKSSSFTDDYIQYKDQEANDFIFKKINDELTTPKNGLMVAKFGTYELDMILYFFCNNKNLQAHLDEIKGVRHIYWDAVKRHIPNTGFFPSEIEAVKNFANLYLEDIKQIDILASYIKAEKYLPEYLSNCIRVNLNGYYAPFLWKNPWTKILENKKVLVVHPFTDSIKGQYETNRENLFEDSAVLPKFKELILVKAVQTIAGNKDSEFLTWFDALDYMKNEINKHDFDIALIGCGAYGLPLAAHVKKMGKIAVHLAGWTQMLFGVYGSRWINDQPEFAKFINEYWIRPSETERPKKSETIEGGCYW